MHRDWDRIRTEYVTGNDSYEQLAQKHGMLKSQLGAQAKKENWPGQRAAYRKSVADAAIRKKRYKATEKLAGLMEAADNLAGHVQRMLADENQFRRNVDSAFVKVTDGVVEHRKQEYLTGKVDAKALSNAARALNEAIRAVRDVYNIPTQAEKDKKQLEERRLRMLEEKKNGTDDGESGVVLMPAAMSECDDAIEVEQ